MNRGFTLLELAIVLTIIGLIVGGVFAGRAIIRGAELNSVITDFQRYKAATQTFRDKYMALPGDMRNATAFWGDSNTACPDATVADGNPGTCNGNGDGVLAFPTESLRFWQQLRLDGLIEGNYTGTGANGNPGTNIPAGRISNSGWTPVQHTANDALFNYSDGETIVRNYFIFGADAAPYPASAIFLPRDAWNIDRKLDDGLPGTGTVKANNNSPIAGNDNCATGTTVAANYNVASSRLDCWLGFVF